MGAIDLSSLCRGLFYDNISFHLQTDDLAMVRSLVVFGADVNMMDKSGVSARHMAATQKSKNRHIRMLKLVCSD